MSHDDTLGPLDELITKGLNALRECLPGDSELTNQVMTVVMCSLLDHVNLYRCMYGNFMHKVNLL